VSTVEELREDAKAEVYEEWLGTLPQPDGGCFCGGRTWVLMERFVYGDDADGNRGVPAYLYQCAACSNERTTDGTRVTYLAEVIIALLMLVAMGAGLAAIVFSLAVFLLRLVS
jgi:hypothetical protein